MWYNVYVYILLLKYLKYINYILLNSLATSGDLTKNLVDNECVKVNK